VPDHTVVVFDEAYYEYVQSRDFPDALAYVKDGRNVVVLRTFSKIYGLAGLRIGYGLTTPEITSYLNRIRPPFNANSMAQRAALAALGDDEHVAHSRAVNQSGMAAVRAGLGALGLNPLPSEANFLYFDVGRDGKPVFEALLREGVIVRHIHGRMLRVTIGLPEENERFLQALTNVLGREPKRTS
jgi:histidinol-phosphate aminotransferase